MNSPAIPVHQYANSPMSMMVWPIMQGISDLEDQASSPSKIPAPNMMGTIPANAQLFVR
ncbi:MAG TPA: hypothetical protein VEV17_17940 [Bryobacteraceae bacterium]|nr:hypothetical protein [Bryobacteraceae bacterium]